MGREDLEVGELSVFTRKCHSSQSSRNRKSEGPKRDVCKREEKRRRRVTSSSKTRSCGRWQERSFIKQVEVCGKTESDG